MEMKAMDYKIGNVYLYGQHEVVLISIDSSDSPYYVSPVMPDIQLYCMWRNEVVPGDVWVNEGQLINVKESKMKDKFNAVASAIAPYKKPLLAAAALIALDYFVFKGALSGRIKTLCGKIVTKLEQLLDSAIERLG